METGQSNKEDHFKINKKLDYTQSLEYQLISDINTHLYFMKTQLWNFSKFPEFKEKYQPILGDKLFFKLRDFLMDEIIGINQDLMHEIDIAFGLARHYKGDKGKVVFMEDFLDRHLGYVTKINDETISLTTDIVYPYFESSELCIIHLLKEKNDANKNYVLSEKFERSFSPPLNENALNELRKFIVDEIIDKTQIKCSKWEKYTLEKQNGGHRD